tara:strand:+ start:2397 stop:2642 length:246 start_codon:yes stop_codon:yes gene_type:complete
MSCNENTAKSAEAVPLFLSPDLLTPAQVAERTGHPVTVLAVYRSRRNTGQSPHAGPDFVKVGREVFYMKASVEAYIARRGA